MDTNHKYFIYVRKSTDTEERQARSIGDQLAEIRELVHRQGLDVIGSFEESQSAMTKGRPLFNEMLERVEAGEADGIIAWHPDRLARNAFDGGRIIDLIDDHKLHDLKFCTFWFEPTAQRKLMLNLAFGQSKYYSDSLSANIRRGQRQKIANGVYPLKAPIGYLNEPKLRTIVPDPVRAPLVKEAFELYATGTVSLTRLSEIMHTKGLQTVRARAMMKSNRIQDLLRNPFYYGIFIVNGETHEGTHAPLVTKATFDRVQEAMLRRSKPDSPRHKYYVYRGLLHCGECGCSITMEAQKGHNYLRCTKRVIRSYSQPYLREETMTGQIAAAIASVSLPDDLADWLIARINTDRSTNAALITDTKQKVRKKIISIEASLDRLTAAYLDVGAFTAAEFRTRKAEGLAKKRKLEDDLVALDTVAAKRFEPLIRFINGSKQLKYVAQAANPAELRKSLEQVGSSLTLTNRTLTWEPRRPWKLVVNKGSLAHVNAALSSSAAPLRGESHLCSPKWRRPGSNRQPPPCKGGALPIELRPRSEHLIILLLARQAK